MPARFIETEVFIRLPLKDKDRKLITIKANSYEDAVEAIEGEGGLKETFKGNIGLESIHVEGYWQEEIQEGAENV